MRIVRRNRIAEAGSLFIAVLILLLEEYPGLLYAFGSEPGLKLFSPGWLAGQIEPQVFYGAVQGIEQVAGGSLVGGVNGTPGEKRNQGGDD
jgi:hypothetical protein